MYSGMCSHVYVCIRVCMYRYECMYTGMCDMCMCLQVCMICMIRIVYGVCI